MPTAGAAPLIDAHTHVFSPSQIERRALIAAGDPAFAEMYARPQAAMASPARLVELIAAGGSVDRTVAMGYAFTEASEVIQLATTILDAAADNPGRIIPLPPVHPGAPGWEGAARDWLRAGATGFGELRPHSQGWDPLGDAGRDLCRLASDSGAVLAWHVSEPVGHLYPGKWGGISPADLCALAAAFPEARMVAAHLGGGIPFYLQMPEVRAALANVYFDTAASSLLYDDESITRLVDLAGSERVLFGSDYPLLSPRRQIQRIFALLPADTAAAVCGGNAELLFG